MSYSTVILYTYRILSWNLRLPQHWSRRQKPQFASPVLWQVRHWTCWPPDCAAGGSFQVLKEGWMTNLPFRWQSMGFLPIDSENPKKRPSFTVFRKDRITFFKPQFFLEKNTWWKTQGFILLFLDKSMSDTSGWSWREALQLVLHLNLKIKVDFELKSVFFTHQEIGIILLCIQIW